MSSLKRSGPSADALPDEPLPPDPLISVVLPVRNEDAFIASTLAQLQAQEYPPEQVEILVCDGRSADRTREIVAELAETDARIRLLDNPGQRSSSGRNTGFRAARGDIVVVVDGHVRIPDNMLLRRIADTFRASGADCLGRPQPLVPQDGIWSAAIVHARGSVLGHGPSSYIYSAYEGFAPAASMGAAYRRHVFDRVGYIDEAFDACEDLEFNTRLDRAGLRCYTSPGLAIGYYARDSLAGLFKQLFRYGAGRWRYVSRFPTTFGPGLLCPLALVGALAVLPLTPVLPAWLAWLAWGGLAACVVVVLAWSAALAGRTSAALFPRYVAVFPTIHVAAALGFLVAMFRSLTGRAPAVLDG